MTARSSRPAPSSVADLDIELAAVVARAAFRLDELDRLRPGDVLRFRRRHDAALELMIDGRTVGTGRAVERGERLGLVIDELVVREPPGS